MSNENIKKDLLQDLLEAGFDEDLAKKAIARSSALTFDSAVEYIEKLQNAKQTARQRLQTREEDEARRKLEQEKAEKEIKEKELERKKNAFYLEQLDKKIKAQQKEREELETLSKSSSQEEDVEKTVTTVTKDDCRIKVYLDSGSSKIISFGKDGCLSELFTMISDRFYNGKRFEAWDINQVAISEEKKSLVDAGFYPSFVMHTRRK